MAILRGEGIVLKSYALGDTSRIVVVFMRDQGLVKLVAKGARKTPSRFGYALEPLSRSRQRDPAGGRSVLPLSLPPLPGTALARNPAHAARGGEGRAGRDALRLRLQ